jgi:hypothetical protein
LKILPATWRALFLSICRVAIAIILVFAVIWWTGIRMPGTNPSRAISLSASEISLRDELKADVQHLAGDIGERNLSRYPQLNAAADFIEKSFTQGGLQPRRDSYEVHGLVSHNIEVEIPGVSSEVVLVGAHYDSVFGAPGANDNGTGVAALLALVRRFTGKQTHHTLRFVTFVNEEPPYFQTSQMGSFVYAARCKARGDRIAAMISLETIGYFSDRAGSQTYPVAALGAFYPRTGNFIGIVGNIPSRWLVRRAIAEFRKDGKIPAEAAALPAFIAGVGWSDQWSFWKHGYPGIMITDTALFRYPHYHDASDTPDKLDYDRFALVVSSAQRLIESLAAKSR